MSLRVHEDHLRERGEAEIPAGSPLTLATIEQWHIGAVALWVAVVFWLVFRTVGVGAAAAGALGGVLTLTLLLIARAIAPVLGDFYRQLQYRERFLMFLAYVGIVFVPVVAGWTSLDGSLCLLVLVIAAQGIDQVHYARLYALLWLLTLQSLMTSWGAGLALPLGILITVALLSIRLGHLRFRIDRYTHGSGVLSGGGVVGRTLFALLPPLLIMFVVHTAAVRWLAPRTITVAANPVVADSPSSRFTSVQDILIYGGIIVAVCISTLVMLHLADRMLRRKKKPVAPPDVTATAQADVPLPAAAGGLATVDEPLAGPRARIIAAFRDLSRRLQILSLSRGRGETPREFVERIQVALPRLDLFEDACYSSLDLSDADASAFEESIRQAREEALHRATPSTPSDAV